MISENCFQYSGLKEVLFPPQLKTIGYFAFNHCLHLSGIILNMGISLIGKEAFSCSALKKVRLPPTLKKLQMRTFWNCKDLRLAEFSEGLEEIGDECFAKTALEKVILPMSIQRIGVSAFYACKKLAQVTSERYLNLKIVGDWAFGKTLLKPKDVFFPDSTWVSKTAFKKNKLVE